MAVKYFDGKQWLDLAGGQQGPPGPQGPQGPAGPQGIQGLPGVDGRGVESIELVSGTHAPGTFDTYRVTFSDETTQDFLVYNGADGQGSPGSQVPLPDGGNGSAGTANAYSREDHQHPAVDSLIWTNPSPDESFSNQTLSLDLSVYRFVEIEVKPTGSYAGNFVIQKIAVGSSGLLHVPYFATISGNDRLCIAKRLAAVSTTGITFSATARWIYNGETTGTNFAIPLRIWGIR